LTNFFCDVKAIFYTIVLIFFFEIIERRFIIHFVLRETDRKLQRLFSVTNLMNFTHRCFLRNGLLEENISCSQKNKVFFRAFDYLYACVGSTASLMSLCDLCHLLHTYCLPILLYGLEAVTISNANRQKRVKVVNLYSASSRTRL